VFVDLVALLEFIELVNELKAIYDALVELFESEEPPIAVELTLQDRKQILRDCTITVDRLNLDLSCFPLGFETTLLFDSDGNPVP
jgi:hypothetical protein